MAARCHPRRPWIIGALVLAGLLLLAGLGWPQTAEADIAEGSCTGADACTNGPEVVGAESCNGAQACVGAVGAVGDNACNAAHHSVGANSCNGTQACTNANGAVGDNACNGNQACFFARDVIGDCEFNTVYVAACEGSDGDGVTEDVDNCADVANADQTDSDGDGLGDACDDPDSDGDGVIDQDDNCVDASNADQTDTDADGLGDACDLDSDNDGVADEADNCPLVSNDDQADLDGDGTGDACDADLDGDGVVEGDACLYTAPGQVTNTDGCAIVDLCPCEGEWQNHGAYVSCVSKAVHAFAKAGLIGEAERGKIMSAAARSSCGKTASKPKKPKKGEK